MSQTAGYAVADGALRGRRFSEPSPQYRSEFQRDRDRIIHSGAFRRLEYKTQVFVNHEGDMFRTRLTHSIEVAQIGRTIARALNLNEDLIEAIALGHDLGHTPFGHAGQSALNRCMLQYGGFEHNLQSLRVVEHLEQRYADFDGLNLTFETREGLLKHCSKQNAAQMGELGERFLHGYQPSLEAQVTDLADQIAYINHDLDDGVRSGILSTRNLQEVELYAENLQRVEKMNRSLDDRRQIYQIVRHMISQQVVDLIETSRDQLLREDPTSVEAVRASSDPIIRFSEDLQRKIKQMRSYQQQHLYRHHRVHRMSVKAEEIISRTFTALLQDPRLLPEEYQNRVAEAEELTGESGKARIVADYIAGMTDRFAIMEYQRLFDPTATT